MGSIARTNHSPISSAKPAFRHSPFPPAPKSVRVVSVFSEGQPEHTPDSRASKSMRSHRGSLWALWLLGITAFLGLVIAALFWAQLWNHLSN